jgi:NAD(P)H-nitrite reductase large subunit
MKEVTIICRCQEVTQAEIEEGIRENDLRTMQEVKRYTRAGMGLCQGKTCGRLVMTILGRETNQAPHEVTPDTPRPPIRAVPVSILANGPTDNDHS